MPDIKDKKNLVLKEETLCEYNHEESRDPGWRRLNPYSRGRNSLSHYYYDAHYQLQWS